MAMPYVPYEGPIVTRSEAAKLGVPRYFTGKPCKEGHFSQRYRASCICVQCSHQRDRVWKSNNRDKVKVWTAKERAERPHQPRSRNQKWRTKNHAKARQIEKAYQDNHKLELATRVRNRRARYRNAEGFHSPEDVDVLLASQNGVCAACRTNVHTGFHVDHIIPLSRGGSNWATNLQILCAKCNLSKGSKTMLEWKTS